MMGSQGILMPASLSQAPSGKLSSTVEEKKKADATKLSETAKEFEATLLAMLLKEMRQPMDEDGGLFPGDTGDVQGGLFDLFMSRHLANVGGIGLAAYLQKHMQASSAAKPLASTDAAVQPAHNVVPATSRR